ncbi:Histone chaperone asf1 [Babesia sp. Xinjiang]|uniref:Histone chaperone asf1 n=1 Tax=Babesia sp. Xinjiang TaxID=462227 RepID=UPI000A251FCA|nr:Histone chaperone asf1 [Babesia sp. Xinjiang]XP_028872108.1 Histone chaperone asf1 [Babesia sp. Xinjiang]ORM41595.1 Histone chaperone asf1 [Babesia sp. Xinjiang]ORM41652.1 Histone chaperone asf1 [Babesia sp. Xinjiang]
MSLVNVTNITVGNNVCPVTAPLVFQIEFECLEDLKHDIEWKIVYVTSDGQGYLDGSQDSPNSTYSGEGEIVLDAVCLGPIYKGVLEFEFRVPAPDFTRLNPEGILGMQAVLVTGNYCEQEFIRIGYYTNNCYDDPALRESPPDTPMVEEMVRCIIDQPRVTRFPIKWDSDLTVNKETETISTVIDDKEDEEEKEDGEIEEEVEEEEKKTQEDEEKNSDVDDRKDVGVRLESRNESGVPAVGPYRDYSFENILECVDYDYDSPTPALSDVIEPVERRSMKRNLQELEKSESSDDKKVQRTPGIATLSTITSISDV